MTTLNSRTCPKCGYITTPDAPFCTQCGTALLGQSYEAPSQPYPSQYQQPSQPYPNQYQQPSQPYPNQAPYPIQPNPTAYGQPYQVPAYSDKNKIAAALLAFFLGGLGIHGFYLGNNTMGITLLIISFVSLPLTCLAGLGLLGYGVVGVICLIQTIMYLVASDAEFYQKYVVEKRWF